MPQQDDIAYGREVLRLEAAAVASLGPLIDRSFTLAVDLVVACAGNVITTGMGKSGLIAQKLSATLASTGTPSFHLHPAEALHGDLGRVGKSDVVIALSNSGQAEEIRRLVPEIKSIGAKLIGITRDPESSLGRHSDCVLRLGALPEACPIGLAPTTSTTAQLALGDALAMTVAKRRNFTREEYARFHPGGALGRSLMRVHEVMSERESAPPARCGLSTNDALVNSGGTGRRPGALAVVDEAGVLRGLLTDGDVRRLSLTRPGFLQEPIDKTMTAQPLTIRENALAAIAWNLMNENNFDELPVVDENGCYRGLLDVQDLLRAGFQETR